MLTLLLFINSTLNIEPINYKQFGLKNNQLLIEVDVKEPLNCWGILLPENSYFGVVTKHSGTAATTADRVTFDSSKAPVFVYLDNHFRISSSNATKTALLFFGRIAPSSHPNNSGRKYINLYVSKNYFFGKPLKLLHCKTTGNGDSKNQQLTETLQTLAENKDAFVLEESDNKPELDVTLELEVPTKENKDVVGVKEKSEKEKEELVKNTENKQKNTAVKNTNYKLMVIVGGIVLLLLGGYYVKTKGNNTQILSEKDILIV